MREEAELYKEKDQQIRAVTELKNEADTQLYTADKALADYRSKIPAALAAEVEGHAMRLREVMGKPETDAAELKEVLSALKTAVSKIGPAMAQQNSSGSRADEEPVASAKKAEAGEERDTMADAEYEEVNKK